MRRPAATAEEYSKDEHMRKGIHKNSLLFKIVCTVIGGISCLAAILSFVNITMSKQVFVDSFGESQNKIFYEIDDEFYDFYSDIVDIMSDISGNKSLQQYMAGTAENELEKMKISYALENSFQETRIGDYNGMSTFVLGADEKSYLYSNSDVFAVSKEEILHSRIAACARNNKNKIVSLYAKSGFTDVMKSEPVIIMAKAWSYGEDEDMEVIAFLTVKESSIRKMYSHFNSNTSDIVLLNQDGEVISSNNPEYLYASKQLAELQKAAADLGQEQVPQKEIWKKATVKTYMMQRLQSTRYKIVGIINPEAAFAEHYNVDRLVILTLSITGIMVMLIIIFMRQQTRPLGRLVDTMRNSKISEFKEHVPMEGTYEVRELSATYNQMVDELERYISQLIRVENDKRSAEIHALQMQINPHYMYNTLSSIKWLVWQGDMQKSTQVIDAFILLLRNVIGNSDEFISVEQEIANLKNYVLINQARYGEAVRVEFFVTPQCCSYVIPKLILQPFVENAFFHAFPEGRTGSIQLFIKEKEDDLQFEIVDNGVGIAPEQLRELLQDGIEKKKTEHFTGIGINNVDERLKLIYGMGYGIIIESEEGKGTAVKLFIKKKTRENTTS